MPKRYLSTLLLPIELFYIFLVNLIRLLYRLNILKRYQADCPVISVGNLVCGGVGKTPFVEMLARNLKDRGRRVAIIMRKEARPVFYRHQDLSDEERMLAQRLPDVSIFSQRNKTSALKEAISHCKPEIVIIDDGFQHWEIGRDLDILLLDECLPLDNGRCLPLGRLREPPRALKRADIIVLVKGRRASIDLSAQAGLSACLSACDAQAGLSAVPTAQLDNAQAGRAIKEIKRVCPLDKPFILAEKSPDCFYDPRDDCNYPLDYLSSEDIAILCAIANPNSFLDSLSGLANIKGQFIYPDHYEYKKRDIARIIERCKTMHIDKLITTEKDAVKLKGLFSSTPIRLLVLRIKMEVSQYADLFWDRIYSLFDS